MVIDKIRYRNVIDNPPAREAKWRTPSEYGNRTEAASAQRLGRSGVQRLVKRSMGCPGRKAGGLGVGVGGAGESKRGHRDSTKTAQRQQSMAVGSTVRSRIRFVGSKTKRSIVSCNECRRRKKRCDEERPQCGACTKRRVDCVYQRDRLEEEVDGGSTVATSGDGQAGKREKESGGQLLAVANVGGGNTVLSPGWYKYMVFSPDGDTDFPPLESVSGSFDAGVDVHLNLGLNPGLSQDIGGLGGLGMKLEMDLDFVARSIIDTFSTARFAATRMDEDVSAKAADKFLKSCALLLPLAYRSRPVRMVLCAWILSMKGDTRTSQFLDEALGICDRLELKIDYSNDWHEDDLIDYIVSLTCLTIISTINGDTELWKISFERLYTGLRKVGLDMLLLMIKRQENRHVLLWVINWFFYQDVFKMIKVTSNRLLGPLFSKKEYLKFITGGTPPPGVALVEELALSPSSTPPEGDGSLNSSVSTNSEKDFHLKKFFDTSISCCMNLYVVLGEINALYDQFAIKIQYPIFIYYKNVEPAMRNMTEEEQLEFVHTDVYLEYEEIRYGFHSWVQKKTDFLQKRVQECTMVSEGYGPIEEETVAYFEVMKLSVLLYLKFKLKELSATNYEIKQIVLGIFEKMRFLLRHTNGRFNSGQLLFPFLIIGANVCEMRDRIMVKSFYLSMVNSVGSNKRNLEQIWTIVQEFWRLNPDGVSFKMWQNILNKYDWNVCVI